MFKNFFRIFFFSLIIILVSFFVVKAQSLEFIDFVNPTGKITGGQYSGNASTTSSFLTAGNNCPVGSYSTGIDVSGNAICVAMGELSETDPKVGTLNTNYIPKWDGTTLADSLIFDDGTNVGIGTSAYLSSYGFVYKNPIAKLRIGNNDNSSGFSRGIVLGTLNYDVANMYAVTTNTTGSADLTFGTALNNLMSERMRITSTGNVGIGTTHPDELLTLASNEKIAWEYTATDISAPFWITAGGINPMNFYWAPGSSQTYEAFKFTTAAGDALTILNGGKVGIGTTTPATKLHVVGGGEAIVRNDTMSLDDDYDLINKGYLDSAIPDIIAGATSSIDYLWTGSLTGDISSANSGNVGIGTASPGAKL
nr:hypothetical protein [Patescibacteria group bacterium]